MWICHLDMSSSIVVTLADQCKLQVQYCWPEDNFTMFYSWDSQMSHVEILVSTARNGVGIDSARGGLTVATNQDIAQVHKKWDFENISTLCILFNNFLIGLPWFFETSNVVDNCEIF